MENGHSCPACGTERAAPDGDRPGPGGPVCECARRAADAHHAGRTADLADAEDFNPLRIRPYVNLAHPEEEPPPRDAAGPGAPPGDAGRGAPHGRAAPHDSAARAPAAEASEAAHTMPLHAVPAGTGPYSPGHEAGTNPAGEPSAPLDEAGTGAGRGPYAPGPGPYAPQTSGASDGSGTYTRAAGPGTDTSGGGSGTRSRRGTRTVLLIAAAAVVVTAGAAFAAGVFDSGPDGTRALPAASSSSAATPVAEAAAVPSPTGTVSPSATATVAPTRSALPTPTRASRTATPTPTPTVPLSAPPTKPPSRAPSTPPPAASPPAKPPEDAAAPASLARGARGPEVRELQDRLSQLWLYFGPVNGRYDSDVEDAVADFQRYQNVDGDREGVYGPATRNALEARTEEP
ncbi:peptidoglycan-binding domain-containing protein [Streptomyces candidus]|uniref:Peptidoglycan binding-like domain-containing protein n=1 Tax=Streptomyces candidus TaxID=67283 RepID=A0A7X0HD26_9ACTN|nr:peptidoglycan-binding domain-containing protein [Streptomyces candidus]MBB6433958.1 hypothetical protein [Streptomyces candidus]GHH33875.1 peptidoglycan-binding protein [Streptomyces candidus]